MTAFRSTRAPAVRALASHYHPTVLGTLIEIERANNHHEGER